MKKDPFKPDQASSIDNTNDISGGRNNKVTTFGQMAEKVSQDHSRENSVGSGAEPTFVETSSR